MLGRSPIGQLENKYRAVRWTANQRDANGGTRRREWLILLSSRRATKRLRCREFVVQLQKSCVKDRVGQEVVTLRRKGDQSVA